VQNSQVTSSLFALLIAAFVVFRFATRELKPRTIKSGITLWARPIIIILLAAGISAAVVAGYPNAVGELMIALAIGVIGGLVVGALIIRFTTFAPAAVPNAVVASGSRITFGIWLIAFVLRFAAHYVVPHSDAARTQLVLNAGTISVLAAALLVIAIVFQRAIAQHAGTPAVSATS
jgi:hypothetical protein